MRNLLKWPHIGSGDAHIYRIHTTPAELRQFSKHEIFSRTMLMSCLKISVQIVDGRLVLEASDPKTWDRKFSISGLPLSNSFERQTLGASVERCEDMGFELV
jgi:hypothetical protein